MDLLKNIPFKIPDSLRQHPLLSKFLPQKETAPAAPVTRLVCDYGKSKIVFLEVDYSASGVVLKKFNKISRDPTKNKETELRDFFQQGGYGTNKVRISVKGQGLIIRFIQFPTMKLQELRSSISFEIDQYIPFKAHEVVWDCTILDPNITLSGGGTGMGVLLVAIKREELYGTIQTFQNAGLQIELIDVDALASFNAMEYLYPNALQEPTAILDIGAEISTLTIVHKSKPQFIRDITYGGADMIKRLRRKLNLTQEQALQALEVDREPSPEAAVVMKEALGDLVADLKVSLNYYLDQVAGAEPVTRLFLEGGGGYHPLAISTLMESLGFKVETMDVLSKLQIAEGVDVDVVKKNQGMLPVSLGLCARS